MFLSYANCTCLPWIKYISAQINVFLFPSLCYDLLMPCFSQAAAELVCEKPSRKGSSGNTLIQTSPAILTEMYRRTCPCQHLRGGLILQTFGIISSGFIGKIWIRIPNVESLESLNSSTPFRQLPGAYSPGALEGCLGRTIWLHDWDSSHSGFAVFLAANLFFFILGITLGDYYALDTWNRIHLCWLGPPEQWSRLR